VPYGAQVVREILALGLRFLATSPHSFEDIYGDIRALARIVGKERAGKQLIESMRAHTGAIRRQAGGARRRPRVYCEAWSNPLRSSEPWVEEMVEAAGGEFVPRPAGRPVSSEEVIAADPEIVVLAWAATSDRARPDKVSERPGWERICAVRTGRIHVIRDELLNTPAPILLEGLDALATIIHPKIFKGGSARVHTTEPVLASRENIAQAIGQLAAASRDPRSLMTRTVRLLQRERQHYNWVGIYLLEGNELVLGPYVGKPTPHTRIPLNQGICGAAASSGKTLIVEDVNSDPRYLACSLETRSEIVVPITRHGKVIGEIDIDSDTPAAFTDKDRQLLEEVAEILEDRLCRGQ
jgi:putative methionine-R-sulfoxide reductase with GAF domain